MPKRARKHSTVKPLACIPQKGLDLSTWATDIGDNSLTRAYNMWHEPLSTGLLTRWGLALGNDNVLAAPISKVHYHVHSNGKGYMVVATADSTLQGQGLKDKLWYVDDTGNYVELMELETTGGNAPSLVSYNGILIIAHGGTHLQAWQSDALSQIAESPNQATVVSHTADRLCCNSLTAPDSVFFSEPEQYNKWSTVEGGAGLIIPAGFGDGMEINALTPLYGMLIVSKVHKDDQGLISAKKMHMISTQGTSAQWGGVQLSSTSASAAKGAMLGIIDSVFLLDTDGAQRVTSSTAGAYGDLAVDTKIAPQILPMHRPYLRDLAQAEVQYVSNLGQIWYILHTATSTLVTIYHLLQDAWTELQFPVRIRSVTERGSDIYLGGYDGRLYRLEPKGTDWTTDGEKPIYTTLRTKMYEQQGGDLILRGVKLSVGRLIPSQIRTEAVDENEQRYVIADEMSQESGSADQKIYDANQKIANATWKIYGGEVIAPQFFDYKCHVRNSGLYLQVRTVGGRVAINSITGLFAYVG